MFRNIRFTVGSVALLAALLAAGPALAQGRWSQMKPIPQGEEEVVGVAVSGNQVYVANTWDNTVSVYNTTTHQTTTIPVGLCVMRTAESVVLTCCPPAPEAR